MPLRPLQGVPALALALTLAGCSPNVLSPKTPTAADGYCLRSGDDQAFDCAAPALPVQALRDPLAPVNRFSDEELMSLLAEVKRWLAQRKQVLQGAEVSANTVVPSSPPALSSTPTPPLPRPWALILNDFSPQSLQRTNSGQH